jgi:hypothetical protein
MPRYHVITFVANWRRNGDGSYNPTIEDFMKMVNDAMGLGASLVGGISTTTTTDNLIIYTQAVLFP